MLFLHLANLLSPPSCSAFSVAQQTLGVLDTRVLPSGSRLDPMASTAPVPPLPGLSNHDHFHASMATLEPFSPSKVDEVLNRSDDDAFSSFMDPFVSPSAWEGPSSCARHAAPVVGRSPRTKAGNTPARAAGAGKAGRRVDVQ